MDFEQAERQFRELEEQYTSGNLDEDRYQIEVAKLMVRDEAGTFWMLDAGTGTWICNRGHGWALEDPRASAVILEPQPAQPVLQIPERRRVGRWLALAIALVVLLASAAVVAWRLELLDAWGLLSSSQSQDTYPRVTITLQVTEGTGAPTPGVDCSPDATFLRDVNIPAGTAFPPGVSREKVWQVRNSGSCAWESGCRLVLREGQSLDAPDYISVPPTAAGQSAELRLSFQAPDEPGRYTSTWQLQAPDGQIFGPRLSLDISVEAQVEESPPPNAPATLQAQASPDGRSVLLTWEDLSGNEDGFRIYRHDVEANIALTQASAEEYLDEDVACGNTYSYFVVAFNASGPSLESQSASVDLPPCVPGSEPPLTTTPSPLSTLTSIAPPEVTPLAAPSPTSTAPLILLDEPPTLTLTVTPTQILASEVFTITFLASDDWGIDRVLVWGVETGDPTLDTGRIFACQTADCAGYWPITWTQGISATWALVALAVDSTGQKSDLAETMVVIRLPGQEP